MNDPGRNDPCACGSGRKFKKCCEEWFGLRARQSGAASEDVIPWLQYSDYSGAPCPWEELVTEVSAWDLKETFPLFAEAAAQAGNSQTQKELVARSYQALKALAADKGMGHAAVVAATLLYRWERAGPHRALLGEKALLLGQCCILAFASGTKRPSYSELVWFVLRLNDYVTPSGPPERGELLAALVHSARFDRQPDSVRALARARIVLSERARTRKEWDDAEWRSFLDSAFGGSFANYMDFFLTGLALTSQLWGVPPNGEPPVIKASQWTKNLEEGAEFGRERLLALTTPLEEATIEARVALAQTPKRLPPFVFRKPLIGFEGETLIGMSPGLVREGQLRTGVWGRCREAMATTPVGRKHKETWLQVFGILFDQYVERIAADAERLPGWKSQGYERIARKGIGQEEIEDLVVRSGNRVLLVSCKASLLDQKISKEALDYGQLKAKLEDFFFRTSTEGRRDGALRLLDTVVSRVRRGEYADRLPPTVEVFPILLTYEHLGEQPLLRRWLDDRCSELGLFQQADVRPPICTDVETLELLLSLMGHGESAWPLFEAATRRGSLFRVVLEADPGKEKLRLPLLMETFNEMTARCLASIKKGEGGNGPSGTST